MATSSTSIELTLRGRVLAWLSALAAGAAWLGGDAHARLAAAMLATPLVVDFIGKQRRQHETELRLGFRRTSVGTAFTETVTIVHRGRRPLRECMLAEPRTMRSEAPVLLPTLRPHAPVRLDMRQRSLQRSHVRERVFVLMSHWPLGMFCTRSVVGAAAELVTEPARVRLSNDLVRAIATAEAATAERPQWPGPEFHSLREHQAGEDARAVHALRSAALGALVRRISHGCMPSTVGIVLDLRQVPGRALGQGGRRFEWGLGACASLLHLVRSRGAEARVLVLGSEPADVLVQGPARAAEVLTLLAAASPSPPRPLPAELTAAIHRLEPCFWIAAGGHLPTPEFAAMPGRITVVGGDDE